MYWPAGYCQNLMPFKGFGTITSLKESEVIYFGF